MLEQELEVGEYYRNRTTQRVYIIVYVDDYNIKYAINEIREQAWVTIDFFREGIKNGDISRLGKLSENELAKYLLQR